MNFYGSYKFIRQYTRYITFKTHFQVDEQSNAMQLAFATTLKCTCNLKMHILMIVILCKVENKLSNESNLTFLQQQKIDKERRMEKCKLMNKKIA